MYSNAYPDLGNREEFEQPEFANHTMTEQRSLEGEGVIYNSITLCDKNNQILSKSKPVDHQPEAFTHAEHIEEEQI